MNTNLRPHVEDKLLVKHVTSRDVAAVAQVSQSAVSRCFTPGASIATHTRERIMQAAASLGYRPNVHARNLITGRTRLVGVVVAHLDNLLYPPFLQQLTEGLQAQGMQVLLFVADCHEQTELMNQLLDYRVDGIVLAATTLDASLARACTDAGIPVVLFNRVAGSACDRAFHSVQTDQESGMAKLVNLLISSGHQRLAYLAGDPDSSTNQTREHGCRQALLEREQTLFAYGVGGYDERQATQQVRVWFEGKALSDCPDAIVAADDRMAMAAIDTLRYSLGLNVPQQVSVVGFDDVPQAAWPAYNLTTYAQPLPAMVDAVLQLLGEQLRPAPSHKPPKGQARVIQGQLRVRGSVRGVLP